MIGIPDNGRTRTILVSFHRGDDIVSDLRKYLRSSKVETGLIVSGVGSLDRCNLHYITSTELPARDRTVSLEGPIEIGSLGGTIAGGEPHVHVVVFNAADGTTHCGDLEPGSRCCYRVEIGIVAMDGVRTQRKIDTQNGLVNIVSAEGTE